MLEIEHAAAMGQPTDVSTQQKAEAYLEQVHQAYKIR